MGNHSAGPPVRPHRALRSKECRQEQRLCRTRTTGDVGGKRKRQWFRKADDPLDPQAFPPLDRLEDLRVTRRVDAPGFEPQESKERVRDWIPDGEPEPGN